MTDESDALIAKAARERRYDLRTPIIRQIYDVMQAIEACGASEKLTHAVMLAGALMEPTRVLLEAADRIAALTAELAQARGNGTELVHSEYVSEMTAEIIALKAALRAATERADAYAT